MCSFIFAFISSFFHVLVMLMCLTTGVPLVLNTSFNVFPGEPIVESPRDAIRAFLGGKGPNQRINLLVVGPDATLLAPKPCPVDWYRTYGEDACLYGGNDDNAKGNNHNEAIDEAAKITKKKAGVTPPRPLAPKRRVAQFRSETSADEHGAPGSVRIWVAGVTADAARCNQHARSTASKSCCCHAWSPFSIIFQTSMRHPLNIRMPPQVG